MIHESIIKIIEYASKIKVNKRKNLSISPSAKVSYRRIHIDNDSKLFIGENSIIESKIIAERTNAVINIGNRTFIGKSTLISIEKISIGNDVLIAWGCTFLDHNSHSIDCEDRKKDIFNCHKNIRDFSNVKSSPIKICDHAWIGFNSIILKGVTIGEGAIVGAGSIVTKDVEPFTMVAGNPAKFIKKIDKNESLKIKEEHSDDGLKNHKTRMVI